MSEKARVLVVVDGGVADYVCPDFVEVVVFDWDNYSADPINTEGVPEHFRYLAESVGVPVGETLEERFPLAGWQAEVTKGKTVLGYRDWAEAQAEEQSHA